MPPIFTPTGPAQPNLPNNRNNPLGGVLPQPPIPDIVDRNKIRNLQNIPEGFDFEQFQKQLENIGIQTDLAKIDPRTRIYEKWQKAQEQKTKSESFLNQILAAQQEINEKFELARPYITFISQHAALNTSLVNILRKNGDQIGDILKHLSILANETYRLNQQEEGAASQFNAAEFKRQIKDLISKNPELFSNLIKNSYQVYKNGVSDGLKIVESVLGIKIDPSSVNMGGYVDGYKLMSDLATVYQQKSRNILIRNAPTATVIPILINDIINDPTFLMTDPAYVEVLAQHLSGAIVQFTVDNPHLILYLNEMISKVNKNMKNITEKRSYFNLIKQAFLVKSLFSVFL
jgi:hypothetical protein